ncbi:MAG: sigma-70 family RNA polymerase sigma factor [Bdellovibrionales bacterium]|nr:sigma-70 family RNA polymerase sigma factor [Bdellovibrionales bacterium]
MDCRNIEINEREIGILMDWVRSIAGRVTRSYGLPFHHNEEIIGSGLEALAVCLKVYDRTKGVPFKGFAYLRVRGAMIDYLRKVGETEDNSKRKFEFHEETLPPTFESKIEVSLEREKMAVAFSRLSSRSQRIIHALYFDGLSMQKIAISEKKSRSWVCRQHKSALGSLKKEMEERV